MNGEVLGQVKFHEFSGVSNLPGLLNSFRLNHTECSLLDVRYSSDEYSSRALLTVQHVPSCRAGLESQARVNKP